MKLRAYLVDDEPLALERLRRLLEETGRVEVVGIATEPEDAVAALSAETPDVCFLDIEMPRLNGFEVLARLTRQPIVIFTTAYNQYALKAFAVNSVDYLLKPVESEDLDRALIKIERLRASGQFTPPDIHTMFRQLMDSMREPRSEFPTFSCRMLSFWMPASVPTFNSINQFLVSIFVTLAGAAAVN